MIVDIRNGMIYDDIRQFKLKDEANMYENYHKYKIAFINKSHVIFKGGVCLTLLQFGKANFGIFSKKQISIKMI